MKVSVIIPTKNAGKQFENVLETVLNQDTSWAFEVLVIDSGSSDGTVEYIESKTNIRSYQIPAKDFGHGKTRNYGASLANGEFLVFITQDALPYNNNWLKEMVAPFDMSDEIVGVFGRHIAYENCDVFEKHNLEVHFNNFGENIVVYKMEDKEKYKQDEGYKHLLCFYSDNSSAMRKSMWKNIPYDDVDFAEDQLWAKKIIELGYSKAYNSNAIVYHSHNYNFTELMKRSYDDHKGLYNIYGYIPVKNILLLPVYIVKSIINDFYFLKTLDIHRIEKKKWLVFSVRKNISKYVGAYLGSKSKYNLINKFFSRELVLRNQ